MARRRRLDGHTALVTGASSGIGADIARELAREGAGLVLTARRRDRLEALAKEIRDARGVDVTTEAVDLGEPSAAGVLYERTVGGGHAIDVLINNAGFGSYHPFLEDSWERYAQMLAVNVTALTELTHRFLPDMLARGRGYVMNVASIGAYLPTPAFAVYGATKAYVRNFTEALDYELRGTGVHAIAVCPGGTRTEFTEVADQKLKPSADRWMMSSARCAELAVGAMLRHRRTLVTGLSNAIGMWWLRWIPRAWLPWTANLFMSANIEAPRPALPPRSDG